MQPQLSANAKGKIAAAAAVVQAGIAAYQIAVRGGRFTWWDVIPIAAAVAAAACTGHVENTIRRPAAKAVVHGALSAVAAISTALAAVLATEPSGVSLVKLLTVAASAALVYYVPELAPAAPVLERAVAAPPDPRDILAALAKLDADSPTPIADEALAAATAVTAPLPAVPATAPTAVTV